LSVPRGQLTWSTDPWGPSSASAGAGPTLPRRSPAFKRRRARFRGGAARARVGIWLQATKSSGAGRVRTGRRRRGQRWWWRGQRRPETPAASSAADGRSWPHPKLRYGATLGARLGSFERVERAAALGGDGADGAGRKWRRRRAVAAKRSGARREGSYGELQLEPKG
jgi:hypothetical protein